VLENNNFQISNDFRCLPALFVLLYCGQIFDKKS
jgi:hypothetical protein